MRQIIVLRIAMIAAFVFIGLPTMVSAQTSPVPFRVKPYRWSSAVHDGIPGRPAESAMVERFVVREPGAPWIRLHFDRANLGSGSFITITSLYDGAMQILDATSLQQWRMTSAYFNGDAVEIQLHVGPNDLNVFLQLREVFIGEPPPESQCGPTDDRTPSNDPRVGRIVPIGCTGWIVNNGLHVTAGHCRSSGTLQFNVPPSLPNGTIQHPPPQDQYSINNSSWTSADGGIGNDWGVFSVFNNSTTGLQPIAAQGGGFTVVQNLGPPNIRITGFGVDSGDRNQTQQTHVGPNAGSSGTTMRYQADTEPGNSGSPVIDDANGTAVGVHTHGGCSTSGSGNNNGTSTFNAAFWAALNVGPPTPTITVTSPNGGENLQIGNVHVITWTSSNVTGNVKIEISRDGGGSYQPLFADTANDGSESWTVTGPATTQARIRVSSVSNPAVNDTSNSNFTISDPPPPPPPPPPPGVCAVRAVTEGTTTETETLDLLYQFRDRILAQTIKGQEYIRVYYQSSRELVGILLNDPSLMVKTQQALDRFLPVIRSLVESGRATVRQADLQALDQLIAGFINASSPSLRRTFEQLRRDIRDPQTQRLFGITVRP
ncbi:MAG: trypsin-like peptidase domain-containing protein [Acidobacteriota bacterium]|nr:trypsin-like peptidase domain-containing protein [Acidobacteriota bacterium]